MRHGVLEKEIGSFSLGATDLVNRRGRESEHMAQVSASLVSRRKPQTSGGHRQCQAPNQLHASRIQSCKNQDGMCV